MVLATVKIDPWRIGPKLEKNKITLARMEPKYIYISHQKIAFRSKALVMSHPYISYVNILLLLLMLMMIMLMMLSLSLIITIISLWVIRVVYRPDDVIHKCVRKIIARPFLNAQWMFVRIISLVPPNGEMYELINYDCNHGLNIVFGHHCWTVNKIAIRFSRNIWGPFWQSSVFATTHSLIRCILWVFCNEMSRKTYFKTA